jgi:regulatory protein
MKIQLNKTEALDRLRQQCSQSEKCRKDIHEKLKNWDCSEFFDEIIKALIDEGFLNEKRYAQSYTTDKLKLAKWGRIKIMFGLRNKGIDEGIIQEALTNLPESEYAAIIEKEIVKKNKALKESDKYKRKQKLFAFCFQRGYDSQIAGPVIDKLLD